MTHISKFVDAAADWEYNQTSTSTTLTRTNAQPGDGYPHTVIVDHTSAGVVSGADVYTDYSPHELGVGPYRLGTRNALKVITNVNNPFRYKTFFEAWVTRSPASMSEKLLAEQVGMSERQIRNARIMGFMDDYTADKLVTKALGIHPSNLFGAPEWIASGLNAAG